jgi:hypothetical protein
MTAQLSMFAPAPPVRRHDGYVIQGSERPADLPRLQASAETIEARVLAWFEERGEVRGFSVIGYLPGTPTMCALELGLKLTTARPRITQLVRSGHLERCAWVPRRTTEDGGSEGYFRFRGNA